MKLFTRKEIQEERQVSLDSLRVQQEAMIKSLKVKTQELNETLPTIELRIKDKQNELEAAKMEHRVFIQQQSSDIIALEDRRKAALKPIEAERRALEDKRLETTRCLLQLGEKQLEIAEQIESLKRKDADMIQERNVLDSVSRETLQNLEVQKRNALEVVSHAKTVTETMFDAEVASKIASIEADTKIESNKRAEMQVRAAMIEVDNRIALEKDEQRKTDNKRKMLGVAISEMKKRGVWHKKYE